MADKPAAKPADDNTGETTKPATTIAPASADQSGKAPNKPVERVDGSKPLRVVLHQSENRTVTEYFNGDDAEAEANARAEDVALRLQRPVYVLKAVEVFEPPKTKTERRSL